MLLQAERGVSVSKARPKKRGRRDRKANKAPTVEWSPITFAPRDGTSIRARPERRGKSLAFYSDGLWWWHSPGRLDYEQAPAPTHWQPSREASHFDGMIGPMTLAQMEGAEVKPVGGWRRKQRAHRLEIMAKPQGKRRHAQITPRQLAAGLELSERYEATLRSPSPPWLSDYVDSTPRPGDVATWQLEAKARYSELSRHVPREAKAVVFAVCCREVPIMPGYTRDPERAEVALDRLCRALDRLADVLRLGK